MTEAQHMAVRIGDNVFVVGKHKGRPRVERAIITHPPTLGISLLVRYYPRDPATTLPVSAANVFLTYAEAEEEARRQQILLALRD